MEKYFAQESGEDLVEHLDQFNTDWINLTAPMENGIGSVWSRNLNIYYNNVLNGDSNTSMGFDGDQGELVKMVVPQARSLNTQFLSLTTKQKLHYEPQALSTEAEALADTRVAASLCERIESEQHIDQKAYRLAELASLMGTSYYRVSWEMSKGKEVGFDPDNGRTIYSGGLKVAVHNALDVAFDHTCEDFYDLDWVRVRYLANRWDLIAEHPDLEDEIRKIPKAFSQGESVFYWQMNINEDMVWVYEFYHKSTPASPLGRYTVYCDKKTIFYDEHNPYRDDKGAFIPVVQMKPEPIAGTGFGYPIFSNLLPLQEMLDHNFSAIASNNNAYAVKSILNPSGNDINVKHIQGLKFINYTPLDIAGGGRPEILDLNSQNSELYNFNKTIIENMQQIYSLNSAIRGEPGAGITSGTAIATLSANAIEFAQNFSKAYVNANEMMMYYSILSYRCFAKVEEIVAIVGPNDSTLAKSFVGSDLSTIARVKASIANPLMATAAGKLEIANNLLQTGQVNFKKYLKILEGAPIESLYERELDEETYIQEENDELRKVDGEDVLAFAEDDHPLHIQCHKSLLDNIAIRRNPDIYTKIRAHMNEHLRLAGETNPYMYEMIKTGQMPQAMMQAQQMKQNQQPPPSQNVPPQAGGPLPGEALNIPPTEAAPPQEPLPNIENQDLGGLAPMPNVGA